MLRQYSDQNTVLVASHYHKVGSVYPVSWRGAPVGRRHHTALRHQVSSRCSNLQTYIGMPHPPQRCKFPRAWQRQHWLGPVRLFPFHPCSDSTRESNLLFVPLGVSRANPQSSIETMARDADGHCRAGCPGKVAQQDQVHIRSDAVSDQGSTSYDNEVDDKLKGVLALSPVTEG